MLTLEFVLTVDFVAVTSVRAFLTVAQFDALLLKNRKKSIKMTHNWVFIWIQTSNKGGEEYKQARDAEPLFLSKFRQLFTLLLFIFFWQVFIITLIITLIIFISCWTSLKEMESFNYRSYQCWTFNEVCYLNRSRKLIQEMPSNGFSAEDQFTHGEFTAMRGCVPSDSFLEPLLCCLYCPERATMHLLTSW